MTWIKLITDFNRFFFFFIFFRSVFVCVLYGSRLRCCVWERSAAVKKNSSGGGVGVDPCSTAGEGGQAPGRHCAVLQPSSVPRVPHSTTDHIQSWTARLCCTFFDSKPIQTSEVSLLIVNFLFFCLNVVISRNRTRNGLRFTMISPIILAVIFHGAFGSSPFVAMWSLKNVTIGIAGLADIRFPAISFLPSEKKTYMQHLLYW